MKAGNGQVHVSQPCPEQRHDALSIVLQSGGLTVDHSCGVQPDKVTGCPKKQKQVPATRPCSCCRAAHITPGAGLEPCKDADRSSFCAHVLLGVCIHPVVPKRQQQLDACLACSRNELVQCHKGSLTVVACMSTAEGFRLHYRMQLESSVYLHVRPDQEGLQRVEVSQSPSCFASCGTDCVVYRLRISASDLVCP